VSVAKVTALSVIFGCVWLSPQPAAAQLLGSPRVTVTSPTSGSIVSGTIAVTARVSGIGSLTVAGVEFYVDGNLIDRDTTAPYSVPWDTKTVGDGSRTLTAVARDAVGNGTTSAPVTVTVDNIAPTVTINQAAGQADPTSASPINFTVVFSEPVTDFTSADVTITGSAGGTKTVVVTGGPSTYNVAVSGMTNGTVIATIRAGVARDAAGNANTASTSTDNTVTFGTAAPTVTRIEETSPAITYTGSWTQGNTDRAWSGGTAALGSTAGQLAELSFSGTGVSWIGFRGPQAGIARVFIDGTLRATVDAFATAEEVQAVMFTATGLSDAPHTLRIEVTGEKNASSMGVFIVVDAFDVTGASTAEPTPATFKPGDVVVSLEPGPVQWRLPDGTLRATLIGAGLGTGEGMAFDASGNLYVARWCIDSTCSDGNTVEMFDAAGQPRGPFGSGYDCSPHAIVFDAGGTAYVGQAGCTGAILKFVPGQPPIAFTVAPDNQGSFWIDLAADRCTIFYTSFGPNVKRFNVCTGVQLSDFNAAAVPGGMAQDLRILPDGGVLVASGQVIARLNASGGLVRTYEVPESSVWAGLDLVGDGTFWAANYETSNVYRFDLTSGTVLAGFNAGTPPHTVVGVRVKK